VSDKALHAKAQALREACNGSGVATGLSACDKEVVSGQALIEQIRRQLLEMQIWSLADSLDRFGFVLPILIDANGRVVAGWGLVLAARQNGLIEVPAVRTQRTCPRPS
jgi:hypothetical protein